MVSVVIAVIAAVGCGLLSLFVGFMLGYDRGILIGRQIGQIMAKLGD